MNFLYNLTQVEDAFDFLATVDGLRAINSLKFNATNLFVVSENNKI